MIKILNYTLVILLILIGESGLFAQSGKYSGWLGNGNAWGNNTSFLGNTDNYSLRFKTNNVKVAQFDSLGNLGINANNLEGYRLYVNGTTNISRLLTVKTSTSMPNAFSVGSSVRSANIVASSDSLLGIATGINIFSYGRSGWFREPTYGNNIAQITGASLGGTTVRPRKFSSTSGDCFFVVNSAFQDSITGINLNNGNLKIGPQLRFGIDTIPNPSAGVGAGAYPTYFSIAVPNPSGTLENKLKIGKYGKVKIYDTLMVGNQAQVTGQILGLANISSSSKTSGIGYAVGSGSTVTQATSRATGVTINSITGAITLVSAAGSTTFNSFIVTNSACAATDVPVPAQKSGTDLYEIHITNVSAGTFKVSFKTTGGTTTEQPVFNFVILKGQTN